MHSSEQQHASNQQRTSTATIRRSVRKVSGQKEPKNVVAPVISTITQNNPDLLYPFRGVV